MFERGKIAIYILRQNLYKDYGLYVYRSSVAQLVEHAAVNRKVAGSKPVRRGSKRIEEKRPKRVSTNKCLHLTANIYLEIR